MKKERIERLLMRMAAAFFLALLAFDGASAQQTFRMSEGTFPVMELAALVSEHEGTLKVLQMLGSPDSSDAAALKAGDEIYSLNGTRVTTQAAWKKAVEAIPEGTEMKVVTVSGGKKTTRTLVRGKSGNNTLHMSPGSFSLGNGASLKMGGSGETGGKKSMRMLAGIRGALFEEKEDGVYFSQTMNMMGEPPSDLPLKPGDAILGLNGVMLKTFGELEAQLNKATSGSELRFAVKRGGERMFLTMKKP